MPPLAPAIVLVDIAHRLERQGTDRIRNFMTGNPEGFASLEEAADVVAGYLAHRPRPSNTAGLARNLRLGDDGRYRWHWDPKFMQRERPTAADWERRAQDASLLTLPVLLVRGGKSDVISQEVAQEFLRLVPHAEYVDVAGAHHMVVGDQNDPFTDAVVDFLRRAV